MTIIKKTIMVLIWGMYVMECSGESIQHSLWNTTWQVDDGVSVSLYSFFEDEYGHKKCLHQVFKDDRTVVSSTINFVEDFKFTENGLTYFTVEHEISSIRTLRTIGQKEPSHYSLKVHNNKGKINPNIIISDYFDPNNIDQYPTVDSYYQCDHGGDVVEITSELKFMDHYIMHAAIDPERKNWGNEARFFVIKPELFFGRVISVYDTNIFMDKAPVHDPLKDLSTRYSSALLKKEGEDTVTVTFNIPKRYLHSYASSLRSHPAIHIVDLEEHGEIQILPKD